MQIAIIAAGFTPGEADQLRRAMAAWKRKGGVDKFQQRLVQGMTDRGYAQEFAEAIFHQIEGFGEYGFPESHAASFALLVYASAWLKRHEPACFLAGLLNSLPMGFYGPVAAGAGRAAPWRRGAPGGRDAQRLGLHAGARRGRAAGGAAGPAPGGRPARRECAAHRAGTCRAALRQRRGPGAARRPGGG